MTDDDDRQMAASREHEQLRRELGEAVLAGIRKQQEQQAQFGELLSAALAARYGPIDNERENR